MPRNVAVSELEDVLQTGRENGPPYYERKSAASDASEPYRVVQSMRPINCKGERGDEQGGFEYRSEQTVDNLKKGEVVVVQLLRRG